jgi:hypothetical protein
MYTGTLAAASNRADWRFNIEITDPTTNALVDLTGATVEVAVCDEETGALKLEANTANGKATIPSLGTITVSFPRSDMTPLFAGSLQIGVTIVLAGITYQLIAGTVPIIDGVVPA